ncbi:MAG: hypothetical protein ACFFAK_15500, partial [Promethearchaeota archaeon]
MNEEKAVENSNRMVFIKKYGGIIFISAILIFFFLLALLNINFGQWLANTVLWFHGEFGDFGI